MRSKTETGYDNNAERKKDGPVSNRPADTWRPPAAVYRSENPEKRLNIDNDGAFLPQGSSESAGTE
ncbi:MAG: hypothetical protein LKI94_07640 [Sporolactobacillus sp.]|nr:hypothetical protein [Sporolactobacillus sp.]MCI1882046.1 hypothetical protein [Sporolactobacillus sp.]